MKYEDIPENKRIFLNMNIGARRKGRDIKAGDPWPSNGSADHDFKCIAKALHKHTKPQSTRVPVNCQNGFSTMGFKHIKSTL